MPKPRVLAPVVYVPHAQTLEAQQQGVEGQMSLAEQQAALEPVEPADGADA